METANVLKLEDYILEPPAHTDGHSEMAATAEIYFPTDWVSQIISRKKVYLACKRVFDIVLSLIALIVLSPVFLITAVAIRLDSRGPVIFRQTRVGKDGKEFTFYKFRSMVVDAEEQLKKLMVLGDIDRRAIKVKNDPRITRVGRFLRRTSIDELPQLINVLNGTMRIVGPRPPSVSEVAAFNEYEMQKLKVHGGLTCFWQVSGRSRLSFDDRIELDRKYISEMGFWTDLKIIAKTFVVVLRQDGAE